MLVYLTQIRCYLKVNKALDLTLKSGCSDFTYKNINLLKTKLKILETERRL